MHNLQGIVLLLRDFIISFGIRGYDQEVAARKARANMKPDWLIQTNMEGVDTGPMVAEVTSQGMVVRPIEHRLGAQVDFSRYDPHDCIICYGDIDFVRQVRQRAPFIPGAWCNFDNMKCSTYYAYFGGHLLNRQYAMMPIGDLLRRWTNWSTFLSFTWDREPLFIRPDSGAKSFTGYVVLPDEKDRIHTLIQTIGPETLVIVAPEKQITAEWRFVICDRNVITGCRYLPDESTNLKPSSLRLAGVIASQEWQPDLCYTVDIAESEGEVRLLEINSFSCAGFYDCNISSIVHWASEVAIKEWKEYYGP